jgi:hypothetical protein
MPSPRLQHWTPESAASVSLNERLMRVEAAAAGVSTGRPAAAALSPAAVDVALLAGVASAGSAARCASEAPATPMASDRPRTLPGVPESAMLRPLRRTTGQQGRRVPARLDAIVA